MRRCSGWCSCEHELAVTSGIVGAALLPPRESRPAGENRGVNPASYVPAGWFIRGAGAIFRFHSDPEPSRRNDNSFPNHYFS